MPAWDGTHPVEVPRTSGLPTRVFVVTTIPVDREVTCAVETALPMHKSDVASGIVVSLVESLSQVGDSVVYTPVAGSPR